MRTIQSLFMVFILVIVAGCAGVGVVSSSDPLTKLNDAEDLFMRQDRPLIAERLIREATAIYQERDDPHGLGNAYREYGDFLTSPAVSKWEQVYRRDGFQDKSVTFDNRITKASEKYSEALKYYQRADQQYQKAEKYDALTNVYYNMAWVYYRLDDHNNACSFYDKTINAYNENIRRNPNAKPHSPAGSIPEVVRSMKKDAGCA